ncbi:hypothetical protein A3L04_05700 [Thermococcus chitonophagus]|uniref:Polymerase beta nucleotidyltransferase domain-containing protein n=1 Tax=Thermococcus chitonophagus TaxID=54262 RepID=A0A160VRN9_9EURY|nr:nucleotidyltransferase domain-containing protein [Thermococcus chitonophagus]ASJ16597.1 hypothetical protein A3L04_05700 [Thermococcus chitonophagus]CUX77482.1 hypothetical protein CHITON_0703 [Thermococcus chitonophagus]
MEKILRNLKAIIVEEFERRGIKVREIILFGSRAKGNSKESSDWDIMVVIEDNIDRETYNELGYSVYRRVDIPLDWRSTRTSQDSSITMQYEMVLRYEGRR